MTNTRNDTLIVHNKTNLSNQQHFQRQHVEAISNTPWHQQVDLCVSMCLLFSILFLLDPMTSSLQEEMLFVCLFDRHHFFLFRIFSSFSFFLLLLLSRPNIFLLSSSVLLLCTANICLSSSSFCILLLLNRLDILLLFLVKMSI